jgi:hypothetical protein
MTGRTDRELLELAAKATGIKGHYFWSIDSAGIEQASGDVWNPLQDDDEADQLESQLDLIVERLDGNAIIAGHPSLEMWPHEPDGNDRAAAYRRAIVRAAAEIGAALSAQAEGVKE